ncbi:MAG TPA: hypothetical protein VLG92_03675 [Candidatus Saccharimonadia bacterium]|nr:hypothetical protein [Candidatus Saccharimonadia bacterium]
MSETLKNSLARVPSLAAVQEAGSLALGETGDISEAQAAMDDAFGEPAAGGSGPATSFNSEV